MKKIKQNRFWFGITTALLAIMLSFTFLGCATSTGFAPLTLPTEPSFHRDAVLLVNTVEETHPIFTYRGGALLPSYYRERRSAFITETLQPMSRTDFIIATRRYVAALHDGHMSAWLPWWNGMFLDIPFIVRNNSLFLASDVEVLRIGGVEIQNIFAEIDRHFFAENKIHRNFNYTLYAGYESILRLAGADISNDGEVTLSLSAGYSTARFTRRSPHFIFFPQTDFIIEYRMIGDVFLIDLRRFYDGEHITNAVKTIEEAVNNGTRYFIMDLRGNPGGNSDVGQRLLEAMGITIPDFGIFRRISPLVIDQFQGWLEYEALPEALRETLEKILQDDVQQVESAPNLTGSSNPNNVFVSVLTDVLSTSSSTMMAAWVQDGGFGNIIGSPSREAPSTFGDILMFSLPYSGIDLAISYSRFSRPDPNADQNVLWPDIFIDSNYALDRALQFFREKRY